MSYVAVHELKNSRDIWKRLARDRQMIVTRDGRPCAILIGASPDSVDEDMAEVRRALFSAAVARVRRRARSRPPAPDLVGNLVREYRAGARHR